MPSHLTDDVHGSRVFCQFNCVFCEHTEILLFVQCTAYTYIFTPIYIIYLNFFRIDIHLTKWPSLQSSVMNCEFLAMCVFVAYTDSMGSLLFAVSIISAALLQA